VNRHQQTCPHCRAKAGFGEAVDTPPEPIAIPELPFESRLFRIYYPAGHHRDYTLHPDGRLTFAFAGQLLTTSLSFADMADMSWEGAHIEWDPEPVPAEDQADAVPAVRVEQAALDGMAA